jgi:hypothetical protein
MTTTTNIHMHESQTNPAESNRASLYGLGTVAALLIVFTALIEIILTFLPGGYASSETVLDWFSLLHNNWFLGLRNLGLLNIIMNLLGIPMFLALYTIHRKSQPVSATLAWILSLIGLAVFYATNQAFSMLELSRQYAAATSDVQRTLLAAAGQALLSIGESHTPGTFLGFFFSELAGLLMSFVMLQGKIFNKSAAYCGILGFGLLFIFEVCSSFVPAWSQIVLIFAMSGGLLSMAWYVLIAWRFSQLRHDGRG